MIYSYTYIYVFIDFLCIYMCIKKKSFVFNTKYVFNIKYEFVFYTKYIQLYIYIYLYKKKAFVFNVFNVATNGRQVISPCHCIYVYIYIYINIYTVYINIYTLPLCPGLAIGRKTIAINTQANLFGILLNQTFTIF